MLLGGWKVVEEDRCEQFFGLSKRFFRVKECFDGDGGLSWDVLHCGVSCQVRGLG